MSASINSLFSSAASNTTFSLASKGLAKSQDDKKSAESTFRDFLKMTPAQKLRASLLASAGVTEEQLKAMDPKDRQAIEDKIAQQVKEAANQHVQKQGAAGFFTDIKA
jgi:hypothetical protein